MTTTAANPPQARDGRPVRRWLLAAVLVLAVLAAAWWWAHPRAFDEPGNSMSVVGTVGTPTYLGLAFVPETESIHLVDASARVLFNDAQADVRVVVCRQDDSLLPAATGADLESQCTSVRPPEGRVDSLDSLVVEVVAHVPGTVLVEGLDVTYRPPYQWGTQTTGMTAALVVEP